MYPSDPLQSLRDLDRTSPHFHNQLVDLLRGDEYRDDIPNLKGRGLSWLVDYLDNVSIPHSLLAQILCEISDPSSVPFWEPLDELKRICGLKNVLPEACTLSDSPQGCVYRAKEEGAFCRSKPRPQKRLKWMVAEGKDPIVVKLWWSFHDRGHLFLVTDFHLGGDLATQWLAGAGWVEIGPASIPQRS